jgi:exodeoxyribonuclease VII large subunit
MSGTNFFDFREKLISKPAKPARVYPAPSAVTPAVRAANNGTGTKQAKLDAKAAQAMSVSQLTEWVGAVIRSGMPQSVLVKGEASNVSLNRGSGHLYFTLKDAESCVDCVMYKSDAERLKFAAQDGMEFLATGNVKVYAPKGKYQLYVTHLQPLGKGALEVAFQQLRAKLETEGLLAAERKRKLPRYPTRIALVTSREAAALQDMLKVLRRFPWLQLWVYHVPVQGDGSGGRIADAIAHLNRVATQLGGVDLILLSRGGGSIEDLWGFNEEAVARAVVASIIPVVTGIGHEVDTTIADLVADYFAHTPTEAASVVTTHWKAVQEQLDTSDLRLRRSLRAGIDSARQRLASVQRHEAFRRPTDRVNHLRQRLDDRERSLLFAFTSRFAARRDRVVHGEQRLTTSTAAMLRRAHDALSAHGAALAERHPRHAVRLADQKLVALEARLRCEAQADLKRRVLRVDLMQRTLEAVSPTQVLRRGYSITTLKKDGRILRSVADVVGGERLVTRVADGQIESTAKDPKQPGLFE